MKIFLRPFSRRVHAPYTLNNKNMTHILSFSLIILENVHHRCFSIDMHVVSRLVDITAGGDFLGLCDQNSLYKYVSDFGRLRSYGHFLIPVHALV